MGRAGDNFPSASSPLPSRPPSRKREPRDGRGPGATFQVPRGHAVPAQIPHTRRGGFQTRPAFRRITPLVTPAKARTQGWAGLGATFQVPVAPSPTRHPHESGNPRMARAGGNFPSASSPLPPLATPTKAGTQEWPVLGATFQVAVVTPLVPTAKAGTQEWPGLGASFQVPRGHAVPVQIPHTRRGGFQTRPAFRRITPLVPPAKPGTQGWPVLGATFQVPRGHAVPVQIPHTRRGGFQTRPAFRRITPLVTPAKPRTQGWAGQGPLSKCQ